MDQELRERGMFGGVANGWQGKVGEKDVEKVRVAQAQAARGKDALGLRTGNGHQ